MEDRKGKKERKARQGSGKGKDGTPRASAQRRGKQAVGFGKTLRTDTVGVESSPVAGAALP